MREYFSVNKIIEKEIDLDFYAMISRLIDINISFETSEILPYLSNYVYLQICGALEKKVEVCQYYLMSINYDYAYKHKITSIYGPDDLFDFFKNIDKYFNIGFTKNNISKNNFFAEFIYKYTIDGELICDSIINNMNQYLDKNNKNSAIVNYFKNQYKDFENYWKNLNGCIDEAKMYYPDIKDLETFLYELYKGIWKQRHTIAHNLNSLYNDAYNDSIYMNNYFFRIALLFNIDAVLIDIMKSKISVRSI